MSLRTAFPLLALCIILATAGCKDDDPVAPEPRPELAPDFALNDVNPTSATFEQDVSPRDHLEKVSAWYFGHATWSYCIGQFGYLDIMQKEIDAMGLPVAVSIHGVNQIGHESGNETACQGKDLPWLQEVPTDLVWNNWQVTYRDVVILDEDNVLAEVFNLSDHNLGDPAQFAALKSLLTNLAGGE